MAPQEMSKSSLEIKKNILILTTTFPRWQNDDRIPPFVFYLSKALTEYYNVYVLVPHTSGSRHFEIMDGICVYRFSYFYPGKLQRLCNVSGGILANLRKGALGKIQVPFLFFFEFLSLLKLCLVKKISLINSHWMVPSGFVAVLVSKLLNIPHILTVHAADIFFLNRIFGGRDLIRFISSSTNIIIAEGSYVAENIRKLLSVSSCIRVVPMGVDTLRFKNLNNKREERIKHKINDSVKLILFVGRLVEKKGLEYLIKAMPKIIKVIPGSKLFIIGEGPMEEKLKTATNELSVSESVDFLGPMGHKQIVSYYAASDAVVIPSIIDSFGETEGMPAVLMESLAMGLPVVASSISGIPDIIEDGSNGWLVAPSDADALARKIIEVLNMDSVILRQISEKARITAERYDWANIGKIYKEYIDRIVSVR
jgi:glycosyltransferase involved in cell wall biosynthesis